MIREHFDHAYPTTAFMNLYKNALKIEIEKERSRDAAPT